jgi:mRNA interferase RelE/StbE
MASFRVEWKPSTKKDLRKIPQGQIRSIIDAAAGLSAQPWPVGSQKLQGTDGTYRIRVGDYRIVYSVSPELEAVTVIRVRHRKDVYRD